MSECATCKGSGQLARTPTKDDIMSNFPKLCDDCSGSGVKPPPTKKQIKAAADATA